MGNNSRVAVRGMLWTTVSVFSTKALSIISQVALGYLIPVETFSIFALVTSAFALTAGFQNSGAQKYLIFNHNQFDSISARFYAFALTFGIIGALAMAGLSVVYAISYDMPELMPVMLIATLAIPLGSVNSIFVARLSTGYRFRTISLVEIAYSLFYYAILLTIAYLGFNEFSIVVATVSALFFQHLLFRRVTPAFSRSVQISMSDFLSTLGTLRWTLVASVLFGLSRNGDYIVLGHALSPRDLGFYYFGFMLTANLGLVVANGIAQTFLPLFAKMKDDPQALRRAVPRSANVIVILGSLICLLIITGIPALVHLIWQGKWDAAVFTALALACTFPVRLLASVSAVVFEAHGRWRLRAAVLATDAGGLMAAAAIGALAWGLPGAAVAVAVQRALSGIIAYPIALGVIGISPLTYIGTFFRTAAPFAASGGLLFLLSPDRHLLAAGSLETWIIIAGEGALALAVFFGLSLLLNRNDTQDFFAFLWKRLRR